MPSLGHIAGSLAASLAVTLLFLLWIGWPGFLAVGAGAVFGVAFLVVATSLGVDPRAADQAWRRHAADLIGARGGADGDGANGRVSEDHESAGSPATTGAPDGASDGTPAP
ncbi:MAG: hypothetical protein ACXWW6_00430 [Candidatus Limnocylindrales bacterium]